VVTKISSEGLLVVKLNNERLGFFFGSSYFPIGFEYIPLFGYFSFVSKNPPKTKLISHSIAPRNNGFGLNVYYTRMHSISENQY